MAQRIGVAVALADDDFHSISDLIGFDVASGPFLLEGFIQAQTFGLIVRFGDQAQPPKALGGLSLVAGGALGVGPVRDPAASWFLNELWVRNATAGSNATLCVVGVAS